MSPGSERPPATERAAAWAYRGVWRVLTRWFHVPEQPPTLPATGSRPVLSFHPSRRYLAYLRFCFWVGLVVIDVAILVGWLAILVADRRLGVWLAAPAAAVAVLPDIVAYIALHLRYDTMWYAMSERSLRCRRGIWVIVEHTITFENVQDVHVQRGPLQYLFGIWTIVIETAGASEGEGQNRFAVGNKAVMEGIDNPEEIRELILERVRRSKTAGLGDEPPVAVTSAHRGFGPRHVQALRGILDEIKQLAR